MPQNLRTLDDLLRFEVCKLYDTESQLSEVVSRLRDKVSDNNLRDVIQNFDQDSKRQIDQLRRVGEICNFDVKREKSSAVEGIIRDTNELLNADVNEDVRDAAIIAALQSAKHFEMACCGSARTYAQQLGAREAADLLQNTLEDEKRTDQKLNEIAINRVNKNAQK